MTKTSLSGREKRTLSSQIRLRSSTQWVPLNLTMVPTSGAGRPAALVAGRAAPGGVGGGSRGAIRTEAVRHRGLGNDGGLVAGVKRRRVDLAAVRAHRPGARSVAEQT